MPHSILIVDDSLMMRELMRDIVESEPGFTVVGEAENGREALEKAQDLSPAVTLLDIEMPEMSGIEALKRLKLISRTKVIIVSSVAQVGSPQASEARSLGAFDVIAKPSGALSLDLEAKRGHEIVAAIKRATA